jgi:hypothetical protein
MPIHADVKDERVGVRGVRNLRREQMSDKITADDIGNLKHMLGAESHIPRRDWGYRNHFAASLGGPDEESFKKMERMGLVTRGRNTESLIFFHATEVGCMAAGLDSRQIKRALE